MILQLGEDKILIYLSKREFWPNTSDFLIWSHFSNCSLLFDTPCTFMTVRIQAYMLQVLQFHYCWQARNGWYGCKAKQPYYCISSKGRGDVIVSPALAGKTHRDHFVLFCCLLSVVVKTGKHLALPSTCFDGFQLKLGIDATWEPSFVDDGKVHISRSKVIWGQVVKWTKNVKVVSFEKLKSDWNPTWFIDKIWDPLYVHAVASHIPL